MKFQRIILFTLLLVFVLSSDLLAQCPMCRMTVESNFADGGSAGLGLNRGIVYLLAAPYLIVGGIAYMWWKNKKTDPVEPA
jgi:hypothetical protein